MRCQPCALLPIFQDGHLNYQKPPPSRTRCSLSCSTSIWPAFGQAATACSLRCCDDPQRMYTPPASVNMLICRRVAPSELRLRPEPQLLASWIGDQHNGPVSAEEIDEYLDALQEPKRATLALLRQTILEVLPEAEQGISYGMPAFKIRGKTVAGFAAFKNHLSYLPHSGSVFPELGDDLAGYVMSSGALRFGIDEPLPAPLVEKLIAVRIRQAFPD
jgi:uncharacterized protein YdhG (YjbR/CyaY superfamily)